MQLRLQRNRIEWMIRFSRPLNFRETLRSCRKHRNDCLRTTFVAGAPSFTEGSTAGTNDWQRQKDGVTTDDGWHAIQRRNSNSEIQAKGQGIPLYGHWVDWLRLYLLIRGLPVPEAQEARRLSLLDAAPRHCTGHCDRVLDAWCHLQSLPEIFESRQQQRGRQRLLRLRCCLAVSHHYLN